MDRRPATILVWFAFFNRPAFEPSEPVVGLVDPSDFGRTEQVKRFFFLPLKTVLFLCILHRNKVVLTLQPIPSPDVHCSTPLSLSFNSIYVTSHGLTKMPPPSRQCRLHPDDVASILTMPLPFDDDATITPFRLRFYDVASLTTMSLPSRHATTIRK